MPRKKILWLCSWYPNKIDPFDGDFIQRHARAAAIFNDVHVIHVAVGNKQKFERAVLPGVRSTPGLTEQVIYTNAGTSYWGRFLAYNRWLFHFRMAVKNHISKYGKPDLIHVHVPMKSGLIAIWASRRYRIPFLVTEHWGIYNELLQDNYTSKGKFFKIYTKKVFNDAVKFLTASDYLGKGVNRLVLKKDFEVIPNSVNTELFYLKSEDIKPKFRFIHVSNMVPLKNVEGILEAAKLLKENEKFELIMIGNRDDTKEQLAKKLGLNDLVSFSGEIPYEEVAEKMQQSNSLILFSNIENSPCVISEALCCGLPVIATRTGGIPELVNEDNGMIIEPKNVEALANAMKEMMKNYDHYDRVKIASEAINRFCYPVIGKMLDRVYSSLLSSQ